MAVGEGWGDLRGVRVGSRLKMSHERFIPVAALATVQDGVGAEGEAPLATEATVHPTQTAINTENTTFSKIRPCI
jgi:hypothetical protein